MTNEREFSFELILEGADIVSDDNADTLYRACDDTTIASIAGEQSACFHRLALSYEEAVEGATRDVESAVEGLKVVRVQRLEDEEVADDRPLMRFRRRGFRAVLGRWS